MFDFKLTKSGDIEEGEELHLPKQKITFSASKYGVQRVSFIVLPLKPKAAKKGEQKISFRFDDFKKTGFVSSSIKEDEELAQAIEIALRTEKNDTYNSDVGTGFYKLKHAVIKGDTDFGQLRDHAAEIVRDLLPGASVEIIKEEYPDAGYFRYETYIVEIYEDDAKIAEFPIL